MGSLDDSSQYLLRLTRDEKQLILRKFNHDENFFKEEIMTSYTLGKRSSSWIEQITKYRMSVNFEIPSEKMR